MIKVIGRDLSSLDVPPAQERFISTSENTPAAAAAAARFTS